MKRKGMAPEMYTAMSIIIMVIVLGTLLFNIFGTARKLDVTETKDTYMLVNALKTAKVYVESSLDFSVYQAFYGNSKYGGYHEITSSITTMTNELLPLCRIDMAKYQGCSDNTKETEKIYEGLKYKNSEYFNIYSVGLLQCILARLRTKSTGEVYYNLQDEMKKENGKAIRQIDCDFGEITDKGVRGFQKDNGLPETGEVDKKTIEKLKEVFQTKWGDCSKFFNGCEDNIKEMVLWTGSGSAIIPSESTILQEVKKSVSKNLGKYTSTDYKFMKELVTLPEYEESKITVEKTKNNYLKIKIDSDSMISLRKEYPIDKEIITMKIKAKIEKEYPIRIIEMYEVARNAYNEMRKLSCQVYNPGDKVYHQKTDSGFIVNAEVFRKDEIPSCKLTIRVYVYDGSKMFPVFNGKAVSFEPTSIEFLVQTP